jgi:hypothetical protein
MRRRTATPSSPHHRSRNMQTPPPAPERATVLWSTRSAELLIIVGRVLVVLLTILWDALFLSLQILSLLSARRDQPVLPSGPAVQERTTRAERLLSETALLVSGGAAVTLLVVAVGMVVAGDGLGPLHLGLPGPAQRAGAGVAYALAATVVVGSLRLARHRHREMSAPRGLLPTEQAVGERTPPGSSHRSWTTRITRRLAQTALVILVGPGEAPPLVEPQYQEEQQ